MKMRIKKWQPDMRLASGDDPRSSDEEVIAYSPTIKKYSESYVNLPLMKFCPLSH